MVDALVIDDNRDMAGLVCSMLEILEVTGRTASGARSGWMALQKKVPDVVFLDKNMPGVDGFEFLFHIRRMPGCEKLPVIMVTSDDQWETINHAKEVGVTSYIVKPVTLIVLETTLKEIGLLP